MSDQPVARASERVRNFAWKHRTMVFFNTPFSERPENRGLEDSPVEQRPEINSRLEALGDGVLVTETVRKFLKSLPLRSILVIHFRGHEEKIGTAVVQLRYIHWTKAPELYPRLYFEFPPEMRRLHGRDEFWGGSILAGEYRVRRWVSAKRILKALSSSRSATGGCCD